MSNTIKESIGAPSPGIREALLKKDTRYSMELWEQCCSVIIFLNKISVGNVLKIFLFSKGNNDLLSITQPQAIRDVHAKYFEAGQILSKRILFKYYNRYG
jgi:5-methyltetrahydrofolate--homocysteine methyltransferase